MQTLTAEEVIEILGLEPHHTCGYVATTFRSPDLLASPNVPGRYGGGPQRDRNFGGTLYFLVTAQAHVVLHAIRSDQVYHHYLGAPLEVLLLYPDGRGEVRVCGPNLTAGERPQLVVPAGTIHMSRVRDPDAFALLGTSEWIEVDPADVTTPTPEELAARFPDMVAEIEAFTHQRIAVERPIVGMPMRPASPAP